MEELLLWEFPPKVREWATLLFFWSGVAIWIGLTARFLIPARVVRGPWLTLCLGFVGSCLGPFALRSFFNVDRFDPIGPCGLLASVCAATATLCLFYAVAFFFPSRFDDEEDENGEESAENEKREKVGEEARRRERRDAPRRREYERADRRDWERDERSERERREYEYAEDELAEARDERERDRRSRPRRRG
ncbi:MAG: hypothetical protein J6K25_05220 [Thermoguttaceae bacterium]|nr:hypothetical protein [Thermoguttaceae bacterium]